MRLGRYSRGWLDEKRPRVCARSTGTSTIKGGKDLPTVVKEALQWRLSVSGGHPSSRMAFLKIARIAATFHISKRLDGGGNAAVALEGNVRLRLFRRYTQQRELWCGTVPS